MEQNTLEIQYGSMIMATRAAWPLVHKLGSHKLQADCAAVLPAKRKVSTPAVTLASAGSLYCILEKVDAFLQNLRAPMPLKDQVLTTLTQGLDVKLNWILTGNKPDGEPPARDLSMRPKEYWETRYSPAASHHWTNNELHEHLIANRFPPNTIRDRLEHHVHLVTTALVEGAYVPSEVLKDETGLRAVNDAFMRVRSDVYAQNASRTQARNQQAFNKCLALRDGKYLRHGEALKEILVMAAKAPQEPMQNGLDSWVAGGFKRVFPSPAMGYEHPLMVCALGNSRGVRLDIRDGRYDPNSLFSTLFSIPMENAAPLLIDIYESGQVNATEIESLIGYQGIPYLHRPVVQVSYPKGG
jgi:hypothetical protein